MKNAYTTKTIIRKAHNKENPYAQISKSVLRDSRLSPKAMGVICYLLGLPDHWRICVDELKTHFKAGKDLIKASLKELEILGYVERFQRKDERGKFIALEMLVHEEPLTGFPLAEKPLTENPQLVITDTSITDLIENNNNKLKEVSDMSRLNKNDSVVVFLLKELMALGASENWIERHICKYSVARVKEKYDIMLEEIRDGRTIRKPLAWMAKAMKDDFQRPTIRQMKAANVDEQQTKDYLAKEQERHSKPKDTAKAEQFLRDIRSKVNPRYRKSEAG